MELTSGDAMTLTFNKLQSCKTKLGVADASKKHMSTWKRSESLMGTLIALTKDQVFVVME